uniref:BLOC-1-related complex subunit 5 n=1 Tax=Trichuris muris TaxID=70415 RepID=A0A5S6Q4H4_TRIMR
MTSGSGTSDSSVPVSSVPVASPYQSLVNTFGSRAEGSVAAQASSVEKGASYASTKCTTSQPAEETYFDITNDRDPWPSPSTRSTTAGQSLGVHVPQAVQDLGQYGPVGLCLLGRDVTREVLHRVVDVCSLMKSAHLSVSSETMKQQQEKLTRAQEALKQAVFMTNRLHSIVTCIENFQQQNLPPDCETNVQVRSDPF